MEPVGRLGNDLALRAVEDLGRSPPRRDERAGNGGRSLAPGVASKSSLTWNGAKTRSPSFRFVLLAHARPDVGVNHVGALTALCGIVVDDQRNDGEPWR